MNKVLVIIGLAILVKGAFDFQEALLGTTTFEDVVSKNPYFEAGYYYFGFLFGLVSAYLGSRPVKIFTSIVGGVCLLISTFTIIDTLSETKWQAEDCASLGSTDAITACLKQHGLLK